MNGNLPTSRTRREFLRTAGAVLGSAVIAKPSRGQDHKSDFFDGVDAASLAVMVEARRQIEQVRKGDFTIRFLDAAGKPIQGQVRLRHVRHEFDFGVNLQPWASLRFDETLRQKAWDACDGLFTMARDGTFWHAMMRSTGRELQPDEPFVYDAVDDPQHGPYWARKYGMDLRWHCLIYCHPKGRLPSWHTRIQTEDQWWPLIEKYIRTLAERNRGWFCEYDVINEMFTCRGFYKKTGSTHPRLYDPKVGLRMFQIADRYLPDARLVALENWALGSTINEPQGAQQIQQVYDYYRALLDRDTPVDILGTQGHFGLHNRDALTMKAISDGLDRFGDLGKPMAVTEYNPPSRGANTPDSIPRLSEEEQAAWSENFYTLIFSKPYMRQLTRWFMLDGLGGGHRDGGVLRADGTPKAEYHALQKLLRETWTTRWEGSLASNGSLMFRGFFGTYDVEVAVHKPQRVQLHAAGPREVVVPMDL